MDKRCVKCISYLDYFKFYVTYKDYKVVFRIDKIDADRPADRVDFIAMKGDIVLDEMATGAWYRSRCGRYISPDGELTVEIYHNVDDPSRFTLQIHTVGQRCSWIAYFLDQGEETFLSHSMLNTEHEYIIGDSPISHEKKPICRNNGPNSWTDNYYRTDPRKILEIKEKMTNPILLDVGLADCVLTLHGKEDHRFIALHPKDYKNCYISTNMLENGYLLQDGLMFSIRDYDTRKIHVVRIIGKDIYVDGIKC